MLGPARDELHDAHDKQMEEANKSRCWINHAITAGAKVFLDTEDLPITYANINPTWRKLVHHYIGPEETFRICGTAVELDLLDDMTIYATVNVSRLKVERTDHSSVIWLSLSLPVGTCHTHTSYLIESLKNLCPRTERTDWEYEVNWESWDAKNNTWEPEENMANAQEIVKDYWKEIDGQLKTKRKMARKVWETGCVFILDGWEILQRHGCVVDQGVLFLWEVTRRWLKKVVM